MAVPGTRLGPYEVIAPLGAGGMGEVFRARDPRLGRDVAIKVLPPAFAQDAERLARFEREARLLAALNHAGIAAIYGLEDAGGHFALVMELAEGPTLAERLESGALREDEALAVARQLADALEYAHDRGIVHRDLKPANIKLKPDGSVKVLDFGLARALETGPAQSSGDLTQSPTITQRMTRAGTILGTVAYLAPEQARGREADRRADIWSFGVVLFEMLTGRRAFVGETITDTLASVMRDDPDWSAFPAALSPRWRRLIQRCLIRDPRQRLQAIGEARIALEDLAAHPADPADAIAATTSAAPQRRAALLPWLVAAAALVALAIALVRRPAPPPAATELSVVPGDGQRISEDVGYHPLAIAPDGRSIAYTVRGGGRLRLRLRRLDKREEVEFPGAEGARNLFFSPDGGWIGFFDSRKLCKVSARGGSPVELASAEQDRLGTWLDDGTIVFSRETTEPLYRMRESGGAPIAITQLDSTKRERTHRFPCALDGGPWVVFTAQTVDSPGGYDDASIDAVNVRTGERRHLYSGARRAAWAPGGYLVLARGSDLYAVPINPRDPRITRDPLPVLSGVSGETSAGSSDFSIARDGSLAWIPGGESDKSREIGWLDRAGRWTPLAIPAGPYLQVCLSPDATRALVLAGPGGGATDLWLADLKSGAVSRLTYGGRSGLAAWTPDGARIVHSVRDSSGGESIVVHRLDGAGGARAIFHAPNPLFVTSITSDGKWAVACDYGARNGRVHIVAVDGSVPARDMPAEGDGYDMAGMVSPDGRWLAYVSNKTGRDEVCVRRFDGTGTSWQLSTTGGGGIRWGREGRELFFATGPMMVDVPLEIRGDDLSLGQSKELFELPPTPSEPAIRDYDYDRASDRFLATRPPRGLEERREIALSLGWAGRLKDQLRASGSKRP